MGVFGEADTLKKSGVLMGWVYGKALGGVRKGFILFSLSWCVMGKG